MVPQFVPKKNLFARYPEESLSLSMYEKKYEKLMHSAVQVSYLTLTWIIHGLNHKSDLSAYNEKKLRLKNVYCVPFEKDTQ